MPPLRFTKSKGLFGAIAIGAVNIKGGGQGTIQAVYGTILPGRIGTFMAALTGVAAGDAVIANPGTNLPAGALFGEVTPLAGTIQGYLANVTAGTISPGTFALGYTWLDQT